MFGRQHQREAGERALEHATRGDFEAIFKEDMGALHMLAFLLTADQAKAEQCFVAGLEESIRENPVFRQWARSWSKRVIIKNAIKMMSPRPGQANPFAPSPKAHQGSSERDVLIGLVLELPPFERFVFVISVLEGHSVSDCASLLGCTITELTRARSQALTDIALTRAGAAAAPQAQRASSARFVARLEMA